MNRKVPSMAPFPLFLSQVQILIAKSLIFSPIDFSFCEKNPLERLHIHTFHIFTYNEEKKKYLTNRNSFQIDRRNRDDSRRKRDKRGEKEKEGRQVYKG